MVVTIGYWLSRSGSREDGPCRSEAGLDREIGPLRPPWEDGVPARVRDGVSTNPGRHLHVGRSGDGMEADLRLPFRRRSCRRGVSK